jgi:hypothetical protein
MQGYKDKEMPTPSTTVRDSGILCHVISRYSLIKTPNTRVIDLKIHHRIVIRAKERI